MSQLPRDIHMYYTIMYIGHFYRMLYQLSMYNLADQLI